MTATRSTREPSAWAAWIAVAVVVALVLATVGALAFLVLDRGLSLHDPAALGAKGTLRAGGEP